MLAQAGEGDGAGTCGAMVAANVGEIRPKLGSTAIARERWDASPAIDVQQSWGGTKPARLIGRDGDWYLVQTVSTNGGLTKYHRKTGVEFRGRSYATKIDPITAAAILRNTP